ncbi:hypothetical protein BZZ01_18600 [Nostocales cyanobacterium HT-58-2]|nr:hypothetical protein BZZ01_18600 [Nostocales cyanobacterium HT-58-2]
MASKAPIEIFIAYHQKDEALFEELNKHLKLLENNKDIIILDKSKILPGQETETKISEDLRKAKIILLLISVDFLSVQSLEVTRATELHADGKALAIPVLLRYVEWEYPPFNVLSPLPSDKTFLPSDESKRDEAFSKIAKGIRDQVKKFDRNQECSFSNKSLADENCQNQVTKLISDADRSLKEEKLEEAALKYQKALSLDPNSVRARISLGNLLNEQNKYKEAIDEYQKAIRLNPDNAEAHFGLGFVLYEENKIDEAVKELREALRLNPDFSLAHLLLNIILLKQGKLEEAKLKEFANFASCDDQLTQSLMKRMSGKNKAILQGLWAIILYKQNTLEETIQKCKQTINFLKTQKRDSETIQVLASFHFWLGKALQDQGKLEDAIVEYRQAVYLDASHVEAHYNLGAVLSKQGKLEEAIAEYRQVLRLDPRDADAHNKLGIALYKQGKLEEAIEQYRQALHFNPNNGNAHNNLGLALSEQGKFEEAIKQLNRAVSLEPNNTIFSDNLKMVINKEKGFWGRLFGW